MINHHLMSSTPVPALEERIEFFKIHALHLGDNILFTNIIYNLALQHEFKAKIHFQGHIPEKQFMEIFDYQDKIESVKIKKRLRYGFSIRDFLNNTFHYKKWTNKVYGESTFKPSIIKTFELPRCKIQKQENENKDYKCYQFNSRSHSCIKPRLNINEIKKMLQMFDEGNSYFIGDGRKTKIEAVYEKVNFDNLINQSKFLLESKAFFGIDSGMSHLAGSLKVPGDIVVQGTSDDWVNCIRQVYGIAYPTLKIHSRKILHNIL